MFPEDCLFKVRLKLPPVALVFCLMRGLGLCIGLSLSKIKKSLQDNYRRSNLYKLYVFSNLINLFLLDLKVKSQTLQV